MKGNRTERCLAGKKQQETYTFACWTRFRTSLLLNTKLELRDLQITKPMSSLPRIDHIIIGAKDLKAAADYFYEEYGLASYVGGKHQGWGTENIIVPLGEGYLEIAAVFDEQLAKKIDWGQ